MSALPASPTDAQSDSPDYDHDAHAHGAIAADGLLDGELLAAAAARVRGALPETPLLRSERLGAWLKLESLQITGAYKVRGLGRLGYSAQRGRPPPLRQMPMIMDMIEMMGVRAQSIEAAPL